ncbi:MAG TPA: oligogalacturonate lyase family protein [Anaerolineae bacterium]|nr:oligogalacturonate lyase family protein [Anaerolineae bacterium]HQH39585.1 oligogalacturonate lyase family protein [Anaerolineae bacterium]
MIGDTWLTEIREFKDEKTGRTIRQLTTTGNNVHLYFTENSFDSVKNEIIFVSDRASGEDKRPEDSPHYNIFRMDLGTGLITQLTDEPCAVGGVTKTPDSRLIVYTMGDQIKQLDTLTGKSAVVYTETGNFSVGAPSIAANRRYIAFTRNEQVETPRGPNYTGFKESFYRIKDGRVTLAYLNGTGAFDVYHDTHWLGHFQFCPDDSTLATFCHEGPWNLVTQRIWILDFVSREAQPCYRQEEYDSIGHEFWTQDSHIFFDDRGPGHDGTITSSRTQAVATEVPVNANAMVPFVGLTDRYGTLIRRVDMPFYCNHYHANPDNTLLVGDDVDDLVLIDIAGDEARLSVLCHHRTSWHTQSSHCHPTWSWDGSRILYASDLGGKVNLYLVEP